MCALVRTHTTMFHAMHAHCVSSFFVGVVPFVRKCRVCVCVRVRACYVQCDSGGLNGRPEKQADVCYSWWILSALAILGRIDWIDTSKLVRFILKCQDADDGGISERPGNMADVFHTFFGVAGLALLGHLDATGAPHTPIDPAFALPVPLVTKLGLRSQTVAPPSRSLAAKPDDAAPCES